MSDVFCNTPCEESAIRKLAAKYSVHPLWNKSCVNGCKLILWKRENAAETVGKCKKEKKYDYTIA